MLGLRLMNQPEPLACPACVAHPARSDVLARVAPSVSARWAYSCLPPGRAAPWRTRLALRCPRAQRGPLNRPSAWARGLNLFSATIAAYQHDGPVAILRGGWTELILGELIDPWHVPWRWTPARHYMPNIRLVGFSGGRRVLFWADLPPASASLVTCSKSRSAVAGWLWCSVRTTSGSTGPSP